MKQAMLKDEVSMYRLQETTLDYVLFKIRELTDSKNWFKQKIINCYFLFSNIIDALELSNCSVV